MQIKEIENLRYQCNKNFNIILNSCMRKIHNSYYCYLSKKGNSIKVENPYFQANLDRFGNISNPRVSGKVPFVIDEKLIRFELGMFIELMKFLNIEEQKTKDEIRIKVSEILKDKYFTYNDIKYRYLDNFSVIDDYTVQVQVVIPEYVNYYDMPFEELPNHLLYEYDGDMCRIEMTEYINLKIQYINQ